MLRVYVAGPYNGPDVISVLRNMRTGIEWSVKIMQAGFAPFCPWLDYQLGLQAEFDVGTYKACSMAWVAVCDAVFLVPGWELSKGALAEIEEARANLIPVFEDLNSLIEFSIKHRLDELCLKSCPSVDQ